jgi:hypothetical protein
VLDMMHPTRWFHCEVCRPVPDPIADRARSAELRLWLGGMAAFVLVLLVFGLLLVFLPAYAWAFVAAGGTAVLLERLLVRWGSAGVQ